MEKTKGKYRFFSRQKGWEGGDKTRHYISPLLYLYNNFVNKYNLINKSAEYIKDILEKNNLQKKEEQLYKYSSIYDEWYLYQDDEVITSCDCSI